MLGNEAFARGAYEAGVKVVILVSGHTEYRGHGKIWRSTMKFTWNGRRMKRWAPKSLSEHRSAGCATLSCMKHVGLNVAADPFFTAQPIRASRAEP